MASGLPLHTVHHVRFGKVSSLTGSNDPPATWACDFCSAGCAPQAVYKITETGTGSAIPGLISDRLHNLHQLGDLLHKKLRASALR